MATRKPTSSRNAVTEKAKDAAGWKSRRRHTVTLASGTEVEIEVPNIPALVKTGQIPNDLIESAMSAAQGTAPDVTPDLLHDQAEFYNRLIAITVKAPEITEDDVPELPYEDVEMLVELATRQRDVDALGRHIGGLHKSNEWRSFRGLDHGDSALAGL